MRLTIFLICIAFFGMGISYGEEASNETEPTVWTIIHAGVLLDVPGQLPRERASIVIESERIVGVYDGYIRRRSIGAAATDRVQVINLKDKFVLPGLLDMHVHLGMSSSFDEDRSQDRGKDTFRVLAAIENAQKTLEAGYTTVRNVGSYGWAVFAVREGIQEGVLVGPRIKTASHTIEIGTYAEDGTGGCYSVESCRLATRRQAQMGADLIKVYVTCSGSKPCGSQTAPPVFIEDELQAVMDVARAMNLKVAAHAHGTQGINLALELGVDSIEHGSYNDTESHQLFLESGAYLVPTLSVQDNIIEDYKTAEGDMRAVMEGFMEEHPKRMIAAYRSGVKIAAGSDAGVTTHGDNASELVWYVKVGMTPMDAIVAATVNGADLLGMSDEIGTIEVGKFADIIAVSSSPVEDINQLKSVEFVMKGGVVFREIEN